MDLKKFSVLVSLASQKILPEFFKLAISRTPWPISVLHWDRLSLVNSSQTKTKFYKFSSLQKQLCKSMERRSVWTLWVALPPQFTFKDFNFFLNENNSSKLELHLLVIILAYLKYWLDFPNQTPDLKGFPELAPLQTNILYETRTKNYSNWTQELMECVSCASN